MIRDLPFPILPLKSLRMKCAGLVAVVQIVTGCATRNDAATTNSGATTNSAATTNGAATTNTPPPTIARGVTVDDTTVKRDWPGCARHTTDVGARKDLGATGRVDTTEERTRGDNEVPWPWGPYDTLYNRPIDSKYRLLLARAPKHVSDTVRLCVKLMELAGAGRVWDIAALPGSFRYKVLRADSTSIVLLRTGDYGRSTSIKFFLDPTSKKLVKPIEFGASLDAFSDEAVATALSVPEDLVRALKERDPRPGPEEPWDKYLPKVLKDNPMPRTTYADFARERPKRVEDGYDSTSGIGEMPGPVQMDSSRIWFGKTFYDGEGESGVGGVGYFDTSKSTYTFLKIPEMAPWSVSALLVDVQILWIGLVGHPEGADYSGGLLRHDLKTGNTKKIPIDDVIQRIKRWNGRIYLATGRGASVIEGDRVVSRFMVEPDLNGEYIIVRVNP
jgi:hypothetical protein